MSYFMQSFKAIFFKDIMIELRSRQLLSIMTVQGVLIVWVLRMAGEGTDSAVMGPAALWIAIIFSGMLAQEKSFAGEHEHGCIWGLLMAPVDEGTIYLAKLMANTVMLCLYELILAPVVMIAFNLRLDANAGMLIVVLLLGNIGLSCVGTLFSAAVQLTRARGAVLSILVLAVLAPMMIPAMLALSNIFGAAVVLAQTSTLTIVGSLNSALGYMIAFDAMFVTICWLLFGFVIKD